MSREGHYNLWALDQPKEWRGTPFAAGPTVYVVDLTVRTEKKTSYDEICAKMKEASEGSFVDVVLRNFFVICRYWPKE